MELYMDYVASFLISAGKCTLAMDLVKYLRKKDLIARNWLSTVFTFISGFMLLNGILGAIGIYYICPSTTCVSIYLTRICLSFLPFVITILLVMGLHQLNKWLFGPYYEILDAVIFLITLDYFFGERNPVRRQQQPAPAA